jgi:predicted O-linked N-acetylglucosamine transferase (SPINDLY family)
LPEPPGQRVCRLDRCAWCYSPPPDAPAVAEPGTASGVDASRPITFGSFNHLAKLSDPCAAAWAEVLRAVPNSRLVLKSAGLADAAVREATSSRFARLGVEAQRITCGGWHDSSVEHLARYAGIDVALDPFPYNGTTTTCEALWMGVPVVTLIGELPHARVGASLLRTIALDDLVATEVTSYVRVAVTLAADVERRAELRRTLRRRVAASPLMNATSMAGAMEAAYRDRWRAWCARAGSRG